MDITVNDISLNEHILNIIYNRLIVFISARGHRLYS